MQSRVVTDELHVPRPEVHVQTDGGIFCNLVHQLQSFSLQGRHFSAPSKDWAFSMALGTSMAIIRPPCGLNKDMS